jgi:hypothetical protein
MHPTADTEDVVELTLAGVCCRALDFFRCGSGLKIWSEVTYPEAGR